LHSSSQARELTLSFLTLVNLKGIKILNEVKQVLAGQPLGWLDYFFLVFSGLSV
jgi:hypothetical protein